MIDQVAVDEIRGQLRTGFPVQGWLYVGAGTGSLLEACRVEEVPHILALEAENGAYEQLRRNFSRSANRQCRQVLVAPEQGEHIFYEASSSRECGLVAPAELGGLWRNLTERAQYPISAKTLKNVLNEEQEKLGFIFNWLTVDCFPAAELLCELHAYADQMDVIEVRVIADDGQSGRKASRREAMEVLVNNGFELRAECPEHHPQVLRLFFVRAWRLLYQNQQRSIEAIDTELRSARQEYRSQVEVMTSEQDRVLRDLATHKDRATRLAAELDAAQRQVAELGDRISALASESGGIGLEKVDGFAVTLANLVEQVRENSQRHSKELNTVRRALERAIKQDVSNSTRQIEAFLDIQQYLRYGDHLPLLHGWPISPDFGRLALDLVDTGEYDLIIEFGAGSSTQLIAQGLQGIKKKGIERSCAQIAFEHLDAYHEETMAGLVRIGVDPCVDLRLASLQPYVAVDGVVYQYYDTKIVTEALRKHASETVKKILILVDGPPASTGPHARYPALPLILNEFSDKKLDVLLDDYSREDEKEVVERWMTDIKNAGLKVEMKVFELEKDACLIRIS